MQFILLNCNAPLIILEALLSRPSKKLHYFRAFQHFSQPLAQRRCLAVENLCRFFSVLLFLSVIVFPISLLIVHFPYCHLWLCRYIGIYMALYCFIWIYGFMGGLWGVKAFFSDYCFFLLCQWLLSFMVMALYGGL